MTKKDLVAKIAAEANITKKAAGTALGAFLVFLGQELKAGGKVTLAGFGTFKVTARKARTGRNPQTGKPMKIKAGKSVRFKASQALKGSL